MIETLDQATVLVLSALAVLFGVPLAMLLWIAAQSIQMRVLRRRLAAVESRLEGLQGQATLGTAASASALGAPADAVDEAEIEVAVPTDETDEVESGPTAPEAETQPEPTARELEAAKDRDWLDVSDLPGVASVGAVAAEAGEATEVSAPDTESESSEGETALDESSAATIESAPATESPARRWLFRTTTEAEPTADAADEDATPATSGGEPEAVGSGAERHEGDDSAATRQADADAGDTSDEAGA